MPDDRDELRAMGLRLLAPSEMAIATVALARIVGRTKLSRHAELVVVRVVADFESGNHVRRHLHGRVLLALMVRGRVRSALTVRGERLADVAELLERASEALAFDLAELG